MFAKQMFHAPETTGGDGAFFRVVGDGRRGAPGGIQRHTCGSGEGAEEAREEIGHGGGSHEDGEEGYEEDEEGSG